MCDVERARGSRPRLLVPRLLLRLLAFVLEVSLEELPASWEVLTLEKDSWEVNLRTSRDKCSRCLWDAARTGSRLSYTRNMTLSRAAWKRGYSTGYCK